MKKIGLVLVVIVAIILLAVVGLLSNRKTEIKQPEQAKMKHMIDIKSPALGGNEIIPKKYTCDGENINPPLEISGVSDSAKSLVLIMDDPDAPMGTFTHWLVWNINATAKDIKERSTPEGGGVGKNDASQTNYTGPCPPSGTHRYFFKVYALDTYLDIPHEATREEVEKAIENHIIDESELVGKYSR